MAHSSSRSDEGDDEKHEAGVIKSSRAYPQPILVPKLLSQPLHNEPALHKLPIPDALIKPRPVILPHQHVQHLWRNGEVEAQQRLLKLRHVDGAAPIAVVL